METELLPKEPPKLAPVEAPRVVVPSAPPKTSWGALVGVVIIVTLLVVAGLYFWGSQLAQG